jgi:ATP-dependent Lon protease
MDHMPEVLSVLPMRETVLFPEIVTPVLVGRDRSKKVVDHALSSEGDKLIALIALKESSVDDPGPGDLFEVGTVARIVQKLSLPEGSIRIVVEGIARVRVTEWVSTEPYLRARVEVLEDEDAERTPEVEALVRSVLGTFQKIVQLAPYSSSPRPSTSRRPRPLPTSSRAPSTSSSLSASRSSRR